MCVRWGSSVSSKFTVYNGVRQGGILSPFLFNIYMDDMSVNLKECPTEEVSFVKYIGYV